jgi:hypothetical protein
LPQVKLGWRSQTVTDKDSWTVVAGKEAGYIGDDIIHLSIG